MGKVLGGSCVVISRVICPLSSVISIYNRLRAPFITTHEPPSKVWSGCYQFYIPQRSLMEALS